jgi:hypothetical protein
MHYVRNHEEFMAGLKILWPGRMTSGREHVSSESVNGLRYLLLFTDSLHGFTTSLFTNRLKKQICIYKQGDITVAYFCSRTYMQLSVRVSTVQSLNTSLDSELSQHKKLEIK